MSNNRLEIKPSTELISDEYGENSTNGVVHVFLGQNEMCQKDLLLKKFKNIRYRIEEDHIYPIATKTQVEEKLEEISSKEFKDKKCLIVIFMGSVKAAYGDDSKILPDNENSKDRCISIQAVWTPFLNSDSLKMKPKIFLFQIAKEGISMDSVRAGDNRFDPPVEADLFINYRVVEAINRFKYLEDICHRLDRFGSRNEIVDFITNIGSSNTEQTICISTLTRRFYLTSGKYRGHHHDISQIIEMFNRTAEKHKKYVAQGRYRHYHDSNQELHKKTTKPLEVKRVDSLKKSEVHKKNKPPQVGTTPPTNRKKYSRTNKLPQGDTNSLEVKKSSSKIKPAWDGSIKNRNKVS